ncbi:MAG: bifunctional DNA-formamidopyrimidine glycosylase/DNA-(apurinic or apyrimidinic site) lyase [Spirochaetales bacterium]|nr:bifunctional DNA-formamidopyrimidine glycosylase/DNA-(apurinic or apyrimidinic site) lyase [Spirochaetales bacterium]
MPELPEVETVRRSLETYVVGRRLRQVVGVWPRAIEGGSPEAIQARLSGRRIVGLERRAKFLSLVFDDDARLLVHLRMTGKLYPESSRRRAPEERSSHISARLELSGGLRIVFEDQRRFGRLTLLNDGAAYRRFSDRFGPEPLEAGFSLDWLRHNLQVHRRMIKPLLLDQSFLAGLGNIYVDEALWLSGIHPLESAHQIDDERVGRLRRAIRQVLRRSIKANGTTFMNFRFLGGQSGGYTDQLLVFRRDGQPCLRCGQMVTKMRVAQRGTHVCESCQPRPSGAPSTQRGRRRAKTSSESSDSPPRPL